MPKTWHVENTDYNTLFVEWKTDLYLDMFQESCPFIGKWAVALSSRLRYVLLCVFLDLSISFLSHVTVIYNLYIAAVLPLLFWGGRGLEWYLIFDLLHNSTQQDS